MGAYTILLLLVLVVGGLLAWWAIRTPKIVVMKRLAIFAVIAGALYVGFTLAFPTYTHRYRLTIEIDTPDGVRSGSSVIEVVRKDYRWFVLPIAGSRFQFRVHGEAVFVDLGAGRNVIAILAHGPLAENVDQMISLPMEAYGHDKWDENAWASRLPMQGPVELKPSLIPTLVTFTDLNDPKTAQVVYATETHEFRDSRGWLQREPRVAVDRFTEIFGPDVHFRRVVLERVSTGTWPFNALGWPSTLVGEPVTRGIEKKLPLWDGPFPWLKPTGGGVYVDTRPEGFRWNKSHLKRDF